MTIIKSFAVGNGDMFYIKHNSDNFSIIDCCINDENKEEIVNEIILESKYKNIIRYISTHPDEDHIQGLDYLYDRMQTVNFYCVSNEATKDEDTPGFIRYCELRDSDKAFYLYKGCRRKWMNWKTEERGSAGISILWPETDNFFYKEALKSAKEGDSPNNISPIIQYSLSDGVTVLWMGDLETDFMNNICDDLELSHADILCRFSSKREEDFPIN
jgi:beta-lactamase superfamily II metal-dependent hydrolase